MNRAIINKLVRKAPASLESSYIFVNDNRAICEAVITVGFTSLYVSREGSSFFTLETLCDFIRDTVNTGSEIENYTFVLACPTARDGGNSGEIFLIDAHSPALDTVRTALQPFVAAAVTTDGTVIGGSPESDNVTVFAPDETTSSTEVNTGGGVNQVIALPRTGDSDLPDAVVASDMATTRVTGVDLKETRTGGALRAGVGVSRIAPGENTTMLVADNIGDSLRIYNNLDVIRLHQSVPIGPHPWDVAWDATTNTAWVTTLGDNKVSSYSLKTGVPILEQQRQTVADAQSLAVLGDGSLAIGSASGLGLQIIRPN